MTRRSSGDRTAIRPAGNLTAGFFSFFEFAKQNVTLYTFCTWPSAVFQGGTEMPAEKARKGLKMKELEEMTGESRGTILYWISQGLLPPPVKTSANMSWYDPRYPKLIEAIRLLQRRMNQSIADIRAFVEQKGGPLALLTAREKIDDFLFGGTSPSWVRMNREELQNAAGIDDETLDRMLELGILRPDSPQEFDEGDLNAASKVKSLLSLGIPLEEFAFYGKSADLVAQMEAKIVLREWQADPPADLEKARRKAQRELSFARQYYFGRAFRREVERALRAFENQPVGTVARKRGQGE
jgi:DNA-binding transcriptional MerR regulator